MNTEKKDKQLTKTHIIILVVAILSIITLFRIYHRSHNQYSEMEMNNTIIQVDGENYEVHTPDNQNIDEETLKELLNDPETKEFLEET